MWRRHLVSASRGALVVLTLSMAAVLGAGLEVTRAGTGPSGEIPLRTVALGISTPDGRDLRKLDNFTASIGGVVPASWTIWSQWGSRTTRDFPMKAARGARARGAVPMIWWDPVKPSDLSSPRFARHANIVAGLHDDYIRAFALDAKRYGFRVLLRFASEANGSYFPWAAGQFDNTPESFVAAWRHVHDIFEEVGARKVRFVWSVAKQACPGGCNPYTPFFPGDDYVDYAAFSSFNWGAEKDNWVPMLDGYTRVTGHLQSLSSRPVMVVETASNAEGGDKAAWIREGYPQVYASLPAIVAIVWLNADLRAAGHPDWRIKKPPEALTAYAEIAAMPEFAGRLGGR